MDKLTLKSIEKCSEILKGEIFECNDTECVVLSDAEECYRQGYKDAIDNAYKWFRYNRWKYEDSREGNETMEQDFRKAMVDEML